jgi:hypothetical protein
MKKIVIIIILFVNFSCVSVHQVKVLSVENWEESELCSIYIKKLNKTENKVYKLSSYKDDTLSVPLRKISQGDEVRLKLLKKRKPRMSKYTIEKDYYFTDELNNHYLIDSDYYSPDIEGLYYIKFR